MPKSSCMMTDGRIVCNFKSDQNDNKVNVTTELELEGRNNLVLHSKLNQVHFEFYNRHFEVTLSTSNSALDLWSLQGRSPHCWSGNKKDR